MIDRNRDWWPLRQRHLDGSHSEWGNTTAELLQRMWVLITTAYVLQATAEKWRDTMIEVAYAYDQWRSIHDVDTHIITAHPLTLGPKNK